MVQLPGGEEFLQTNSGLLIEAALALGADNASPETGVLDGYKAKANHAGTSEADKKRAQEVLDRVSAIEGRFGFSRGLQFARQHVELLEGFSLDYEPTTSEDQ